jgi:hypothetical protein
MDITSAGFVCVAERSIPDPCTLLLLGVGGMMVRKIAKRKSLN